MQVAVFARVKRDGVAYYPAPVEFTREAALGVPANDPLIVLDFEDAQRLADELWAAGVRPAQGKQSEGVTGAQGKHLEDMRAIAFGKLMLQAP